jgi:hypothetical protein
MDVIDGNSRPWPVPGDAPFAAGHPRGHETSASINQFRSVLKEFQVGRLHSEL